jgi:hypothetical protein
MVSSTMKRIVRTELNIYAFFYYHWVDTSDGGLLVPDGIIRPIVSDSELTLFIIYFYILVKWLSWQSCEELILNFLHNMSLCVQMTSDCIGNLILIQSWLLFPYSDGFVYYLIFIWCLRPAALYYIELICYIWQLLSHD